MMIGSVVNIKLMDCINVCSSLAVTLTRQNLASPFSIRIRQSNWLIVLISPLLYHQAVWSALPSLTNMPLYTVTPATATVVTPENSYPLPFQHIRGVCYPVTNSGIVF